MSDLDIEERVRDIFPAEVLTPDGAMLTACRVFISNRRLIVWRIGERGSPYVALEMNHAEPLTIEQMQATMMKDDPIVVTGDQGSAYINKGLGGCCGHLALKALIPPWAMS